MRTTPPAALLSLTLLAATLGAPQKVSAATLQPHTLRAWDAYIAATEARIGDELRRGDRFLTSDFAADGKSIRDRVARDVISIGKLATADAAGQAIAVPDGLVAHWRGAVLLRGATLDTLLHRLQHPDERGPFQEDVLALKVITRRPDHVQLAIRMTRRQIVTVTYDTEHVVDYSRHGATRASSRSVSRRIVEIADAGTARERSLAPGNDRGFLWRMHAYWRYEQVADGVIVELESVTLSRGVPFGLGAITAPLIDRIARESVERTLQYIRRTYAPAGASRSATTISPAHAATARRTSS